MVTGLVMSIFLQLRLILIVSTFPGLSEPTHPGALCLIFPTGWHSARIDNCQFNRGEARADVPVRVAQAVVEVHARAASVAQTVVQVEEGQPLTETGGRQVFRTLCLASFLANTFDLTKRGSYTRKSLIGADPLWVALTPPIHPCCHLGRRASRWPSARGPGWC